MVSEEIIEFKKRKLKEIYPFVYMDCMYVNVKEEMISEKKAVYVALGIDIEGNKEILDFWIGDSESSSFWYGILDELKERGVKDILYLCSDGVAGFKEILEETFPKTIHQRCIVHIIRNLTKCTPRKQWKELCDDLKTIYKTIDIESAKEAAKKVLDNWCRYKVIKCTNEKQIEHCGQCSQFPCDNIRECFEVTKSFEPFCKQVCTDAEYAIISKAFFEKEKNLSDK